MQGNDAVSQYEKDRDKYKKLAKTTAELIETLLGFSKIKGVVTFRAKEVASFSEKIRRPGKNYSDPLSDVTDLAGVRVILQSLDAINKVADIIDKEFVVDRERSVNKINQLESNQFGYLSQHYVVQFGENRINLAEYAGLDGLKVEIQIRTSLQDAWAVIQYAFDYKKTEDIPKELMRRLYRVSALLEVADEELNLFMKEVQVVQDKYKDSFLKDEFVALNIDSLRVMMGESLNVEHWRSYLKNKFNVNVNVDEEAYFNVVLECARRLKLNGVKEVDEYLGGAKGWGEDFVSARLNNYYKNTERLSYDGCVHLNIAISFLLIAVGSVRNDKKDMIDMFGEKISAMVDAAIAAYGNNDGKVS